jgi:hypothetical protein
MTKLLEHAVSLWIVTLRLGLTGKGRFGAYTPFSCSVCLYDTILLGSGLGLNGRRGLRRRVFVAVVIAWINLRGYAMCIVALSPPFTSRETDSKAVCALPGLSANAICWKESGGKGGTTKMRIVPSGPYVTSSI